MNTNTPYNNLKIFAHAKRLQDIKENKDTAPVYIRIKPTNKCNHNCSYCHYRSPYLDLNQYNYNDFIPREKMLEIVSSMKNMGVKAVTFSGGGEPLMYPYIEEAMEKILEAQIDLSIITNGSLLSGRKAQFLSKAKWVRISMESGCEETYDRIRGIKAGSFENLCSNIKEFAKIKDTSCELGINFVIGKENYNEVYEAGKLMKDLGVNHIKYTAQISNNTEKAHELFKEKVIEQIHKLIDMEQTDTFKVINLYESDFNSCVKFGRAYDKCYIKDFVTVIAANSKMYYCHDKAYLDKGEIGDLTNQTLEELWYSEDKKKKFEKFNPKEICHHHCVYDDRNLLLNSYYSLDKNHINFI